MGQESEKRAATSFAAGTKMGKRSKSPGVWDSRRALFLIDSGHEIAR
jgi:hypothetical protein